MSGLRARLASGVALAAGVLAAVAWLPLAWLAAFLLLLALVAAWEWAKLAGVRSRWGWLLYAASLAAVAVGLWLAPAAWRFALALAVALWVAALVVVWAFAGGRPGSVSLLRSMPVALAVGVAAIGAAWLALLEIRAAAGAGVLVWLLAATSLADIGAYFAGRRFGRRKLAVRVSPNKTWEGLLGGVVACLAWGGAAAFWFGGWQWLLAALAVAAAAVVGDLFESALKRARDVKDSGGILPGHGGLLDRVDSVLAAAPVFALLLPHALRA